MLCALRLLVKQYLHNVVASKAERSPSIERTDSRERDIVLISCRDGGNDLWLLNETPTPVQN